MINASSRAAVDGATWRGPLIRPLYDSYCFANLPSAIERRLTGKGQTNLPPDTLAGLPERCDTVILFFIDAFGWRFFQRYRERYPFLRHFIDNGVVSTLTSMFPSTTAAHVTCRCLSACQPTKPATPCPPLGSPLTSSFRPRTSISDWVPLE